MDASTTLRTESDALADRFRSLPASRLGRAAGAGLELARELSARGQRIERPDGAPLVMPDDGMWVTGDQIAVAGHDLAAALDASGAAPEEYAVAIARITAVRQSL